MDSVEKIERFVAEMSFEEFAKDEKIKSAVLREIEVIGETAKIYPIKNIADPQELSNSGI